MGVTEKNLAMVDKGQPVVLFNAGDIEREKLLSFSISDHGQPDCFVRLPNKFSPGSPIFVSVHGITRNPLEHMIHFAPLANKFNAVLIAPVFSSRSYRGYQQLLCRDGQCRADHFLDLLLAALAGRLWFAAHKFHFFGFSGGGQFVHRYAMAYPEKVKAAAIAAAGWYTFPDPSKDYPLGTGQNHSLHDVNFNMEEFLKVRFLALVGTRDIKQDKSLNQSADICVMQGQTRVDRARNWVNAMNKCARERSMPPLTRMIDLHGVGHSFSKCMTECNLGEEVMNFLFQPASGQVASVCGQTRKTR